VAPPRIAVVGADEAAARHQRLLEAFEGRDAVDVVAVASPSGGDGLGAVTGPLDGVVVAGAVADRPAAAAWALARGIGVLVDTPMALDEDGGRNLASAVAGAGADVPVAQAGHDERFHPPLIRLKSLLVEAAVGPLVAARLVRGQYLPVRHPDRAQRQDLDELVGAGPLVGLIDTLDLARWLCGEPTAVHAFGVHASGLETSGDDVVQCSLALPGALASVHLDDVARDDADTVDLVCESGVLRWSSADNTLHHLDGAHGNWVHEEQESDAEMRYRGQLRHFLACMRDGRAPKVTLADGLRTHELAMAARRSAATGGTTIRSAAGVWH
jgi:predicted dehydrogenase